MQLTRSSAQEDRLLWTAAIRQLSACDHYFRKTNQSRLQVVLLPYTMHQMIRLKQSMTLKTCNNTVEMLNAHGNAMRFCSLFPAIAHMAQYLVQVAHQELEHSSRLYDTEAVLAAPRNQQVQVISDRLRSAWSMLLLRARYMERAV